MCTQSSVVLSVSVYLLRFCSVLVVHACVADGCENQVVGLANVCYGHPLLEAQVMNPWSFNLPSISVFFYYL